MTLCTSVYVTILFPSPSLCTHTHTCTLTGQAGGSTGAAAHPSLPIRALRAQAKSAQGVCLLQVPDPRRESGLQVQGIFAMMTARRACLTTVDRSTSH